MPDNFRVLIVDDEPRARKGIRRLLKAISDIDIIGECTDGFEAVAEISASSPDIVFLDVQMPGLDGFGVVEKIGVDRMPAIIFITAFNLHALRAFQVHAIDYLLKPVNAKAFAIAVDRAKALRQGKQGDAAVRKLSELLAFLKTTAVPSSGYPERFMIKSPGKTVIVQTDEIDWCESEDDYVRLHLRKKGNGADNSFLMRQTTNDMEAELNPAAFVRIHRSTIVRIGRIKEVKPLSNGDQLVLLVDGTELTMSRHYRKKAMTKIGRAP